MGYFLFKKLYLPLKGISEIGDVFLLNVADVLLVTGILGKAWQPPQERWLLLVAFIFPPRRAQKSLTPQTHVSKDKTAMVTQVIIVSSGANDMKIQPLLAPFPQGKVVFKMVK